MAPLEGVLDRPGYFGYELLRYLVWKALLEDAFTEMMVARSRGGGREGGQLCNGA